MVFWDGRGRAEGFKEEAQRRQGESEEAPGKQGAPSQFQASDWRIATERPAREALPSGEIRLRLEQARKGEAQRKKVQGTPSVLYRRIPRVGKSGR